MIDHIFDGIIGQKTILELLSQASAHPAPGYLFLGPRGLGKITIAERLARLLLDQPLDQSLESHPDFIRLKREEGKTEITIKQIRECIDRLILTPARGKKIVALIENAEHLNEESANALLKIVEEPPAPLVFLFISSLAERLPATLRSRLVLLPFQPVKTSELAAWLVSHGATQEQAYLLAHESRGCPSLALHKLKTAPQHRPLDTHALFRDLQSPLLGRMCGTLERLQKNLDASEDPQIAWQETLTELMAQCASQMKQDPERMKTLGEGLIFAWRLTGGSLSPRLGLEWSRVCAYLNRENVPFFLKTSL